MNCFDNLIGLKGICDGNSVAFYLEQYGITSQMLKDINYTHDDLKTLLTDKLDEASLFVSKQVKSLKAGEMQGEDTLASDRVGYLAKTRTSVAAKTGYDAGVMINMENESSYVRLNIDSISIFATQTGDVSVLIYDLTEGRLLDTVTVAAVAGQQGFVDIDKSYRAQQREMAIGILYDSSFASYKTTPLKNNSGCGSCQKGGRYQSIYATVSAIKIADGADKLYDNVKYESDTAGLSVTYTVQCDYEQWICKNKQVLLSSVFYYTAYHIAEYGLNSPRLNSQTTDMREVLKKIRDNAFSAYNSEIQAALGKMVIPQNDCFKCRQKSRNVTTL